MLRIDTDTCDAACPATALVTIEKAGRTLMFCGHCFDQRVADVFAAGFSVREDRRPEIRAREARR